MSERYIRYYDSASGTTSTSTYSFDKTKKYKLNKSSGAIEEVTTSNPLAEDEISIAGSKSSLRRLGDLERNVSILASKAGISGATNVDTDTVLKNNKQALHATDALRISANKLYLYKGDGTSENVDLSLYLDDTNAAVIQSGVVDGSGIATFTRDDASTFTVDMSVLLDDTNLPRITSASWNTGNGVLTMTRNDSTTITVDLDGRFQPAGVTSYTLPAATSAVRGGIELASDTVQSVAANAVSATAGRTYGVQVNSAGQAVVNVPWVDTNTNTTYSAGSGITLSGTTFSNAAPDQTVTLTGAGATSISGTYPDFTITSTDTVYTLPAATSTVRGGIELFSGTVQSVAANAVSATAGRTYGVQVNSAGQAVVNVPWVDTNTDTNTWRPVTDTPAADSTTSISANWAYTTPFTGVTVSNDTLTFSRPDGTTTAVTTSDANTNYYVTGGSFDASTQVLTLTRNSGSATVDLSGLVTSAELSTAISDLVNGADAAYDTLKEIQDAMATDAELSAAIAAITTVANANKWTTARTITLGGDASGSVSIDGSANVTLTVAVADDSHNHIISNVDGLQAALDGKSATTHNHTLDSLSNTTITSVTDGELLVWDTTTSKWINNTLAEAGIQPAGSYLTSYTETDTLASVTARGATTSTAVTFSGGITGNVTGNVSGSSGSTTGNAATATKLATARTIGMSGVTATATSFDGSANITIPVTAVPTSLLTGVVANAQISGSYTGMTNLTGSGTVDFAKFLGNAADTVTAPSFSWTGDTNTGIYQPAADQLGITTGGVSRAVVSASGLSVTGAITATGDVTAYSDDRLKTDITTIDGALDKVAKVRGVNFTRKEDGSRSTGVVAQELAAVLPEAVKTDEYGMHHVAYGNITGLLIEAIKELKDEIDYLKGLK
jgi:hypothetical protein